MAKKYLFEFKYEVVTHDLSRKDTSARTAEKFDLPIGNLERFNRIVRYDWLWCYNHERPNMGLAEISPIQNLN